MGWSRGNEEKRPVLEEFGLRIIAGDAFGAYSNLPNSGLFW